MDKIRILEEIKVGFQNLPYKDNTELDRLERRLKMLIGNLYDDNSKYLEDLDRIHFFPLFAYEGMPETDDIEAWDSGKNSTVNLLETIIEEQSLFFSENEEKIVNVNMSKEVYSKVFIVHGHDDGAKNEVARFVEKLGFGVKILHEQASSGATIIEKLEKHTDAGFAIVLYTPCDIGAVKSDSDNLKPRARQNVVFEHGLLIGKIGRKNVVALLKDDVEIPNDISGVVYESMDSKGAWKLQLAKEMKASGYDVDMNKV